jgi:methylamine dehydrogenase heavy chain
MKLKPNRHLFLAACFMALLVGCSDSSQPVSSDDRDDAEQAAPDVAQAGTSQAASQDTTTLGDGPAITGADALHPDDKPVIIADGELPPLPIEETGRVATLPMSYPESWVMVDEASFFSMFGGKVIVLDVAETKHSKRIKGLVHKNLLGNFTQSKTRGEFYILETFHARGGRGPREDVLAIYDKQTLSIKKELVWPKPNRMQALPERYAMALSSDEKLLYAANFDPAASFNVVDLDSQKIVAEIGTPGCVLTYPLGKRSVASLCSNGAMMTSNLKVDGTLDKQSRSEPFFDTDDTPIFEHAVFVDGIAHFPSFKGLLHSFDMTGEEAKYLGSWDMLTEQDKKGKWRPSGLGLNDFDDAGLMYTIFQPDGHEGTHTQGGTQVWVFDLKTKQRVRVIETPNWAISIAVTRGAKPLLVVTNGELNLDVFNAQDGSLIQTVSDFGNVTPLLVHKSY